VLDSNTQPSARDPRKEIAMAIALDRAPARVLTRPTAAESWAAWRADVRANPRDPKAVVVLFWFRACQWLAGDHAHPRMRSWPFIVAYRAITECLLGIELRPRTPAGPGLSIFHGTGLVVSGLARLGSDVQLRSGVVIGQKAPGGGSPVIGDRVSIGANAVVLGEITVGDDVTIGANAVVIRDVPDGATVAGVPARVVSGGGSRGRLVPGRKRPPLLDAMRGLVRGLLPRPTQLLLRD
jgi:serine acetyltransferase